MVAECVGLDIGRTAFKAVRFRRRLSGRESVEYFHHPMPFGRQEDLMPARRAGMLRTFLWQNGLYTSGRLVTALPCHDLFIRTLSFPFRDRAKLEQVVPYEVESLIPMPLDDVAVGSIVLPPGAPLDPGRGAASSDVLVTAAPRDKVAEHLRFLAEADLDPSAINVDGMALYSVARYLKEEGGDVPADLAIIDVGASKTTLCLVHEGSPVLLRTILWGGNHLTHAIAVRYACSFAEAERRKRAMTAQQVDAWLEPLLKELRVTLHSFEGNSRARLTHCWVSGGGSKLKEIGTHVSRHLGLHPVGPRQGFGPDSPRAFSIAFGLAIHPKIVRPRWKLKSGAGDLALDFKEAVDRKATDAAIASRERRLAAWGLLILAVLALGDLTIRLSLKESRVGQLRAALQSQYEQVFGTRVAPGDELDQARFRVDGLNKSLALVDGAQTRMLGSLSLVAKQMPAGIPVKVRELTIEGGSVHLEAETNSFDAVEKIKQAFLSGPSFQDVAVSDTRVGAAANQVIFRLGFMVQAP